MADISKIQLPNGTICNIKSYKTMSIPMGSVDSTSTSTAFTATVDGINELIDGVCVWLTNGVVTSAAGYTIDINGLGAKPVYISKATETASSTQFNAAYTVLLIYNSSRVSGGCWDYVYGYDADTTYSLPKLGCGYTTCSTATATAAKTASLSNYVLATGGIVCVKFTNDVNADATLNINSKGAKNIYYQGAKITNGIIKANDTVVMVYSSAYHIIAIDRALKSFSNIKVNSTTITADTPQDTLELVAGTNITLTPDANNDKVTINADLSAYAPLASPTFTGTPKAPTATAGTNTTQIATTEFVQTAIDNLPEPMVFKGSLGTGGTITALPVDGSATVGDTYKVIENGTYDSKAAKIGDTFICLTKTSSTNTWELIPSGDEPSGTVTSITIKGTSPIVSSSSSAITTSGTRTISHANSGVTAGTYKSVTVNATGHVTAGTNPTTLSGYGITDAKIENGTITLGSNTIIPITSVTDKDETLAWGEEKTIATVGNTDVHLTMPAKPTYTAADVGALPSTTKYAGSSSAGGPALSVSTAGGDVVLGTYNSSSDDSGDIVWKYGNGQEKARLWQDNTYTAKAGPQYRIYKSDGTGLYSGRLPLADGTSASGTWGISITGNASTSTKATQDGDGNTISSTYLKLSGGTMTGIIKRNAPTSGAYIKARDNALVYANANAQTSSLFCVFGGAKSKTGFWGVGTVPTDDSLFFSWGSDTNYANNTNTTNNFSISSTGAFSGTAAAWTTARTLTLGGQLTGSVSVKGDANMTLSGYLKNGLICDESSDFASYAWHKFAEITIAEVNADRTIVFLVSKTWGDVPGCSGILIAHIRTNEQKTTSAESINFGWFIEPTGIDKNNFVLIYTNTANTSTKIELWYKQTSRWDGWVFTVLRENTRVGVSGPWTIYTATGHGTATYTTGSGDPIKSYSVGIANSITGTAANVTGTVAIAHGGTGATTRLAALKALTEQNVGTSAQYFLTITNSWGKGGYTSVADAKTVLGLGSAAYTASTDYILSHGNLNGTIGNNSPAADVKTFFMTSSVPAGCSSIGYNTAGNEYTLIFGKGVNTAGYGAVLKFGYDSLYPLMLRIQNGTWKSTDWEKISAGYADSAGTATTVATEVGTSAGARPVFYAYLGDNTRVVYNTNFTYNPSGNVLTAGTINTSAGINANTANSSTAGGLSLYGTNPDQYGVIFRGTSQKGKHGYVTSDWATYFTMNDSGTRGWIFTRNASSPANVASISGAGNAVFNGSVTVGGNAANTSGCRMVYNSTTQSLDFVFV